MVLNLGTFDDIRDNTHSRLLSSTFHGERLLHMAKKHIAGDIFLTWYAHISDMIIPITSQMVEKLNIGINDLQTAAKMNARYAVKSLNELFGFEIDAFHTGISDVCIATNLRAQGGASAILDPTIQDQLSERFPDGYFVILSSVDETLIVHNDLDTDKICQMIHDINRAYVEERMRLSDHLYMIRDGKLAVVA